MHSRVSKRAAGRARALAGAAGVGIAGALVFAGNAARGVAECDAPHPVPGRLSETGLYQPDGTVDPRNRSFTPQYPLWTDGARKSRWIRLPVGAAIDVSDIDAWRFPAGTMIWKEFAWNGRKVETRMLRAEPCGQWSFATYVWEEDQSDALLAPPEGVPAAFEIAPGKLHSIPAVNDCNACHKSAPSAALGFNALQLSDDRDPLAPHAESLRPGDLTLKVLAREGRLAPPRADLAQQPPRIRESDPVARAALGYLSANCGACHNTRGPLARLGFSLLHEAGAQPGTPEAARATAVGAKGRFVAPGTAAELSRIVAPGAPEHSTLLHRMKSRRPASQMPPLGSAIVDDEAVELVRQWIEGEGAKPLP